MSRIQLRGGAEYVLVRSTKAYDVTDEVNSIQQMVKHVLERWLFQRNLEHYVFFALPPHSPLKLKLQSYERCVHRL